MVTALAITACMQVPVLGSRLARGWWVSSVTSHKHCSGAFGLLHSPHHCSMLNDFPFWEGVCWKGDGS